MDLNVLKPLLVRPMKESDCKEVDHTKASQSFDVRMAWPQRASVLGQIRDQSFCGKWWAFDSTEAFNDKLRHYGRHLIDVD